MKISTAILIEEFVTNRLWWTDIAIKHDMAPHSVEKRYYRLVDKGMIPISLSCGRNKHRKDVSNTSLSSLYLKGSGITFLSKIFAISQEAIRRRLKKIGILDSSRQFQKKYDNQASRRRDRRIYEFRDSTKQFCFKREHGICQECHTPIGDGTNWRQATYHHIKPIALWHNILTPEQLRHPDNCMVLHTSCHNDPATFQKLHGFDIQRITTKLPKAEPRLCISCHSVPPKTRSGHCHRCAYNLISGGFTSELSLSPSGLLRCKRSLLRQGFIRGGGQSEYRARPDITVDKVAALSLAGLHSRKIASILHVSYKTVCNRLALLPNL